jgi:hypothetical protein
MDEAEYLVKFMDRLIEEDDSETALAVEPRLARVHDSLPTDSPWREQLKLAWKKALAKWH